MFFLFDGLLLLPAFFSLSTGMSAAESKYPFDGLVKNYLNPVTFFDALTADKQFLKLKLDASVAFYHNLTNYVLSPRQIFDSTSVLYYDYSHGNECFGVETVTLGAVDGLCYNQVLPSYILESSGLFAEF